MLSTKALASCDLAPKCCFRTSDVRLIADTLAIKLMS